MKAKNRIAFENLSLFCHFSGMIVLFLGITVVCMDLMNKDFKHIQVGLFIFAVGYAVLKISTKINNILEDENRTTE